MSPQELKSKLRGVIGFPATPFHADMSLNAEGLRQNVAWMKTTGVCAIAPVCGTGEFFSLNLDEYVEAVETVVEEVGRSLPVFVGVGHGSKMAVEWAQAAEELGADGLLVLPPYLITPEPEGLANYASQIAGAVEIGILLYHRGTALYSERAVEKLLVFEHVVGFKDGQGDLDHFSMLRRRFGDRLVWLNGMPTAEMTAPSYFAAGAAGYTSAISNFLPGASLEFFRACQAGDSKRVWEITDRLVKPICDIRNRKKGYNISFVKAGLEIVGRAGGPVRPPLLNLDPQSREDLRRILAAWP
ncbi:MAG: 5-dehydro-4-deoxyglucarate dehydratase [Planctomycetes bacterium]|nr:5-dehydro-4-deoxyglucarate dehydratase [Planctomycetota bacterium]